jgi:hypothetical protein
MTITFKATFVSLAVLILSPLSTFAAPTEQSILLDLVFPRKDVPVTKLGINAFVNDPQFGGISTQFAEVKGALGIKKVRLLFPWIDEIQPTPSSKPKFAFFDEVAKSIPPGVQALVVVTDLPSWMENPANWIDGDPRKTFVKRWVRRIAKRYRKYPRIKAIQIWNEPNDQNKSDNHLLDVADSPANYVALMKLAMVTVKQNAKKWKIVGAATTALNQNFPDTLTYNKGLLAAGIEGTVDVYGVHVYGYQPENFYAPDGVLDLFESITRPIWVTESGAKGINSQLEYAERMWPFLLAATPRIKRIYCYQFTENTAADSTYGLKNPTVGLGMSDLYWHLYDLTH